MHVYKKSVYRKFATRWSGHVGYRLDYFLKSDEDKEKEEEEKKKEKSGDDINPFAALFGLNKKDKEKKKGDKKEIESKKDIKSDSFVEKSLRVEAANAAAGWLYTVYDIYKKAHGMASAPGDGFDKGDEGIVDS